VKQMLVKLITRILSIAMRVMYGVSLAIGLVFVGLRVTPAYTQSSAEVLTTYRIYLPFVVNNFPLIPATPMLNAISNEDGDGNYTVSWSSSVGASTYTLQEATNADFSNAITAYSGPDTSKAFSGRAVGTYYYRVRASNEHASSGWSNIRQVTVSPPMAEVYVKNDTGGELCFRIDNTGIGQKCFSSGTHLYGTFPSGTYTWYASAWCGSISGSEYYEPGVFTHEFWCE
jgi:hypothetical protein